MTLQLNLTDLKGNLVLLKLLKKLNYIEVREIKKSENKLIDEAEQEHKDIKAAFLLQSKRFLADNYEKFLEESVEKA